MGWDALTHGATTFRTTLFYPLSDWGFNGIRWWQHPEVVMAYWLLLPAIWFSLWYWRRTSTRSDGCRILIPAPFSVRNPDGET